jgi:hypothetical protein
MPSKSRAQQKLMHAIANSPEFASKVGIPQSVGQDYAAADHARGKQKLPDHTPSKKRRYKKN